MKRTSIIIFVMLALLDVVGISGLWVANGPPAAIPITSATLGIVTLAAVIAAWRGNRGALIVAIVSRILAALLGVPAFFADAAPAWSKIVVAIAIVLTALGVWLALGTRRTGALALSST